MLRRGEGKKEGRGQKHRVKLTFEGNQQILELSERIWWWRRKEQKRVDENRLTRKELNLQDIAKEDRDVARRIDGSRLHEKRGSKKEDKRTMKDM